MLYFKCFILTKKRLGLITLKTQAKKRWRGPVRLMFRFYLTREFKMTGPARPPLLCARCAHLSGGDKLCCVT